jgi:hypothetical protein
MKKYWAKTILLSQTTVSLHNAEIILEYIVYEDNNVRKANMAPPLRRASTVCNAKRAPWS